MVGTSGKKRASYENGLDILLQGTKMINEKALDRLDKIKAIQKEKAEFEECIKYKICPLCGEDLSEFQIYFYKCGSCFMVFECIRGQYEI